jgi:arylsulfatase A-like enzyme
MNMTFTIKKDTSMKTFLLTLLMAACGSLMAAEKPNILIIFVDDMGWSDIGAYGSEIKTPNLDSLAMNGIRFTQFYNTSKCNTSRACLLTGLYAQQCGMMSPGAMKNAATLGEVLRPAGYRTLASGKHHGTENLVERGFDHYYGLRDGCCNFWNPGRKREGEPEPGRKSSNRAWCDDEKTYQPYTPEDKNFYTTDAFTDRALKWLDEPELKEKPFLLYLAFTAPHYPLHAWPKDIAKYKGVYDGGYETIRKARYERMVKAGLVDPAKNPLPAWDGDDWKALSDEARAKEIKRMEIYAAMLDRVDQNVGRVVAKLKAQGKFENTVILFASDNGGCAEGTGAKIKSTKLEDFGTVASYETVGQSWATVQNTPLRKWKNWSLEGGIRTPLIVHWPKMITSGGKICHEPAHLIDIMPTAVELSNATYPPKTMQAAIPPMQGVSLVPTFTGNPLRRPNPIFWQWSAGGAIRDGNFKAVFWGGRQSGKSWELHDMSMGPNEANDLSKTHPEKLEALKAQWEAWYASVSLPKTSRAAPVPNQ